MPYFHYKKIRTISQPCENHPFFPTIGKLPPRFPIIAKISLTLFNERKVSNPPLPLYRSFLLHYPHYSEVFTQYWGEEGKALTRNMLSTQCHLDGSGPRPVRGHFPALSHTNGRTARLRQRPTAWIRQTKSIFPFLCVSLIRVFNYAVLGHFRHPEAPKFIKYFMKISWGDRKYWQSKYVQHFSQEKSNLICYQRKTDSVQAQTRERCDTAVPGVTLWVTAVVRLMVVVWNDKGKKQKEFIYISLNSQSPLPR